MTDLDYDLLNVEAKTSMKSKFRQNNKRTNNDQIIKRVIFNPEKSQEKHFLALLLQNSELFDYVKDMEEFYFSDLHFRSVFNYWKKEKICNTDDDCPDIMRCCEIGLRKYCCTPNNFVKLSFSFENQPIP